MACFWFGFWEVTVDERFGATDVVDNDSFHEWQIQIFSPGNEKTGIHTSWGRMPFIKSCLGCKDVRC